MRVAAVALEGELDVLGGDRLAIMEGRALAQHELVAEAVLRGRPGFSKARRQQPTRHRLHQRVVQRVQDHERGNDPRGLRRVEPGRRQRDVRAPNQLALRRRGEDGAGSAGDNAERGQRQRVAPCRVRPAVTSLFHHVRSLKSCASHVPFSVMSS